MGKNKSFVLSDFYCMNCGNKGISLPRRVGHQYKSFHRKTLYCLFCQCEVNHIECKTPEDVQIFKKNFENGEYKEEAINSIKYIKYKKGQK